ncbi:hypothetical protein BKA62DRAFT_691592 [Auriculariales sp. MPI-PUGE-AT-0066]|nr:hypothetical protein BKA62DRAFT_691592 [Auriculariales sp. MPI-PUGE-AT-0066]
MGFFRRPHVPHPVLKDSDEPADLSHIDDLTLRTGRPCFSTYTVYEPSPEKNTSADSIVAVTEAASHSEQVRQSQPSNRSRIAGFRAATLAVSWVLWVAWIIYVVYTNGYSMPHMSPISLMTHDFNFMVNTAIGTSLCFASLWLFYPISFILLSRARDPERTIFWRRLHLYSVPLLVLCVFVGVLVPEIFLWKLCLGHAVHVNCDDMDMTIYLQAAPYGILSSWNNTPYKDATTAQFLGTEDGKPYATWALAKPTSTTLEFSMLNLDSDPSENIDFKLWQDSPRSAGSRTVSMNGVDLIQIKYDLSTRTASTIEGYTAEFGAADSESTLDHLLISGAHVDGQPNWSAEIEPEQLPVELRPIQFTLRDGNGSVVLKSLTKGTTACRRIKLCSNSWDIEGDTHNAVQALIPLGLALYHQAQYSFMC